MNKQETLKIVVTIESLFNNALTRNYTSLEELTDEQLLVEVVNTYHDMLKEFDFEAVKRNLIAYSQSNSFAPKIADLVKGLNIKESKSVIPDVETTKKMLDEKYAPVPKEKQLSKERINEMLIQTIGRGLKNL